MKEKGGRAEQGKQGFILPGSNQIFSGFPACSEGVFFVRSSLLCCFSLSLTVLAAAAVFAGRLGWCKSSGPGALGSD